jgi:hypothetical protein
MIIMFDVRTGYPSRRGLLRRRDILHPGVVANGPDAISGEQVLLQYVCQTGRSDA